jgi:hypothetical protein
VPGPIQHVPAQFVAQLCPQCAMCCNGVLFKDVELEPGDDGAKLKALGLPISKSRTARFPQPCAALEGCTCRVYGDRPVRCRDFDCALLQSLAAGRTEPPAARRAIQQTRERAEKVRRLLRELGDTDERVALSQRFKHTQRRLESLQLADDTAEIFGQLTLAAHDLNLLLRQHFYPAATDSAVMP